MPSKSDFRAKTATTVVRPEDFHLDRISKVVVREHFHALPLCTPKEHHAACASFGREIGCVRVMVDYKKPRAAEPLGRVIWGARCTHLHLE